MWIRLKSAEGSRGEEHRAARIQILGQGIAVHVARGLRVIDGDRTHRIRITYRMG